MAGNFVTPTKRPIIDEDGFLTQEARLQFNKLEIGSYIVGSGSPEGVVTAKRGVTYKDLDGTTGSISYFKRFDDVGGDARFGWVLE